jgi:hypothetical protein
MTSFRSTGILPVTLTAWALAPTLLLCVVHGIMLPTVATGFNLLFESHLMA